MFCKKKVGTFLAVAAAGVLSIAIAVPAVASSDAVKGIYAFFSNEKYYTKSPIEKNDLTSYAEKQTKCKKRKTVRFAWKTSTATAAT